GDMTGRRTIVLAAGVLAALVLSASLPAARTSSPSALAKQLAAAVVQARTPAQRYAAVLSVMKALRVPVFTAQGKQLSIGGTGLPRGFNLYDFELHAVADSFQRTIGVADLARLLTAGGARADAESARRKLVSGVAASVATASSPKAALALLVRELGLRHRTA